MLLLLSMVMSLLPQDAIDRTCDLSKTTTALWCSTCDGDAAVGKHDGHTTAEVTVCEKKLWTNG